MICVATLSGAFSDRFHPDLSKEDAMIRLGCNRCDASEDEIPDLKPALNAGWTQVEEVQSYEDACREVEADDKVHSVLDWQTHLGMCPRCSTVDF